MRFLLTGWLCWRRRWIHLGWLVLTSLSECVELPIHDQWDMQALCSSKEPCQCIQRRAGQSFEPVYLHKSWQGADKRFQQSRVKWLRCFCHVATEWLYFIISGIHEKSNIHVFLSVWPELFYPQINHISPHLLCSVVSTQQKRHQCCVFASFMMNDLFLFVFFFPLLSEPNPFPPQNNGF